MKPRLTLYTRAGCCLCDDAKAAILAARSKSEFAYEEIDIDGNAELKALYSDEVPVVAINGVKAFKYRIDPKELLRKLAART